jgi:hypothetical protein
MGRNDDDDWLDDAVDQAGFERTLEGQTILGTGGALPPDQVIRLAESDDD